MKWAKPRNAGVPNTWTWNNICVHDLVDDDENLLGYVREDKRPGYGFTATPNKYSAGFPKQFLTLKEAKESLVAHFVLEKLEQT